MRMERLLSALNGEAKPSVEWIGCDGAFMRQLSNRFSEILATQY